jgi:hypothetical protein
MKWIIATFVCGFLAGQFSQDESLKLFGYRFGIGSDGYALQSTTDWHVVSQGWFPWHKPSVFWGDISTSPPSWTSIKPGDAGGVLIYKDGVGTWQFYEANQKDEAK